MPGFGDTLELRVLQYLVKRRQLDTPLTAVYVALHVSDAEAGGAELSGGGYARVSYNTDTNESTNTYWTAVQTDNDVQYVTNAQAIQFPQATADWNSGNPITAFGLWSASTGGTLYVAGSITGSGVVVLNNNTLILQANALRIQIA